MTVAEMISRLQELPQDLEVWTYGIDIGGSASASLAQPPEVYTRHHGAVRVIIDGGCV